MSEYIIIGNLENRRVDFFREALKKIKNKPLKEIHYLDILQGRFDWLSIPKNAIIRLESPGENFEVEKELISKGSNGSIHIDEDFGRVRHLSEWYRGYKILLKEIEELLQGKQVRWFNTPDAVITMFDKNLCHQAFEKHKVNSTNLIGRLENYQQLRELMNREKKQSVFIKPANGSSASGIIALKTAGSRVSAYSSLSQKDNKLYNSLRISNYTNEINLRQLINTMAAENCIVEEWLPKAKVDRYSFDLRIVVVDGRACQHVVRCSKSPMTNLHLGNKRGDHNLVEKHFGKKMWEAIKNEAEKASKSIPGHHYAGVDVMINSRTQEPVVIEINAFGDLIPNITHEGLTTYESELNNLKI